MIRNDYLYEMYSVLNVVEFNLFDVTFERKMDGYLSNILDSYSIVIPC